MKWCLAILHAHQVLHSRGADVVVSSRCTFAQAVIPKLRESSIGCNMKDEQLVGAGDRAHGLFHCLEALITQAAQPQKKQAWLPRCTRWTQSTHRLATQFSYIAAAAHTYPISLAYVCPTGKQLLDHICVAISQGCNKWCDTRLHTHKHCGGAEVVVSSKVHICTSCDSQTEGKQFRLHQEG